MVKNCVMEMNEMKQKMYKNLDGTGPTGRGPRTGRGRGNC